MAGKAGKGWDVLNAEIAQRLRKNSAPLLTGRRESDASYAAGGADTEELESAGPIDRLMTANGRGKR